MNQNEHKARVEARLEQSLRRQIRAPKLDGRFDAAVWARIASETQASSAAPAPRARARAGMPRWLVASNVIGAAVTVGLLAWCTLRSVSGLESAGFDFTLPTLSEEQMTAAVQLGGYAIAAAATGFGLLFTRAGRRMLSAFR